ncbi:MAG TPA: hypothetical protein VIT91_09330 [Chthoniobacterales bacterium]
MPPINSAEGGVALELSVAAAQYFDVILWITLAAALLLSAAAFVVMHLYVRAVFRESRRGGSLPHVGPAVEEGDHPPLLSPAGPLGIQTETPGGSARPPPARSPTFQHAETAPRRVARIYALGGTVHAAISSGLLFLFGVYTLPSAPSRLTILACYAAVFWAWSFFTIVALVLFWGPNRRLHGVLILGYFGVLLIMGLLLHVVGAPRLPFTDVGLMTKAQADLLLSFARTVTGKQTAATAVTFSPVLQPIAFWSLSAAPVLIPFLAFNRFIRGTVGPLFIILALIMVLSSFLIIDLLLYTPPGVWLASHLKGIFGDSTYRILVVISLILSAVVAWFGLLWIARRYRRKHLSDQTFLFDALWLSVSLCVSVYLMGSNDQFRYLLGLLPFAFYKITVGYGLKRIAVRAESLPKARLLFLRVFGSPRRSERLFDLLAARWRYSGSIQLISATDVVRGRFEPDEFLDFLSGRLASAYISTDADLERRVAGLDVQPDPDGRYRINEFFCRVDTWQKTVKRLMAQSDLVAMDLRAFTSERKGCIFELGALIDEVPLHRVVLLIDQTTDEALLRRTLADLWQSMNPRSPNAHGGIAHVRMIDLARSYPAAVRRLMQLGDEVIAAGRT